MDNGEHVFVPWCWCSRIMRGVRSNVYKKRFLLLQSSFNKFDRGITNDGGEIILRLKPSEIFGCSVHK